MVLLGLSLGGGMVAQPCPNKQYAARHESGCVCAALVVCRILGGLEHGAAGCEHC